VIQRFGSILSQFLHFFAYRFTEQKMELEKGMLIVSIDVDVGKKEVGVINKGKNDRNVNKYINEYSIGEIEERAFPLLVDFFNNIEIPVTFAVRGQLTEVDTSTLDLLLSSHVSHDIGAHGYYHRDFAKLSYEEANEELDMISVAMKKFGIAPKSFVFPANSVAHLELLERHGYLCYRDRGGFMRNGMYIRKRGRLYDVHPGLYIGQSANPTFLKKIIDIAIARRLPFHVWFHPWNFGETTESIQRGINTVLFPTFKYAKKKEKSGSLTFETMLSAAKKVEAMFNGIHGYS